MSYNFDKLTSRHNTNCWKWDIDAPDADVIPLWVADMDFEAAPKILDALRCRLDHAVFGYTKVPNSFYEAIQGWYSRRNGCRSIRQDASWRCRSTQYAIRDSRYPRGLAT